MIAVIGVVALIAVVVVVLFLRSKPSEPTSVALSQSEYRPFKLIKKDQINHNTIVLRYACDHPKQKVGLPVGMHMGLRLKNSSGQYVYRPYTPISSDYDIGYFDMLIKVYRNGQLTPLLDKLKVGEITEVRGPLGNLEYQGQGKFNVRRKDTTTNTMKDHDHHIKHIGMIAGGSGITPMYQILQQLRREYQSSSSSTINVTLIFGNVAEEDILLRQQLDELKRDLPHFNLIYLLDKPPAGWTGGVGYVTVDMLKTHMPAPGSETLILTCGPKPMQDSADKHLASLDYHPHQIFHF